MSSLLWVQDYYKIYSQTSIKRPPFGQWKKLPYKTDDFLKEIQFIWNFLWQDKKKVTF
jgi:hypothetical protein